MTDSTIVTMDAPCPGCGGILLAAVSTPASGLSIGPVRLTVRVDSVICTGCGMTVRLPPGDPT